MNIDERTRIINLAEKYLLSDGLIFSLDDLVKELKRGKAKLYYYFVSKEELAKAIFLDVEDRLKNKLDKSSNTLEVLSIYQEAIIYTLPRIVNRYSIDELYPFRSFLFFNCC